MRRRDAVGPGIVAAIGMSAMGNGGQMHDDVDAIEERRPIEIIFEIRQLYPLDSARTGNFRRSTRRGPDAMAGLGQRTNDSRANEARRAGDQNPKRHRST